MNPLGKGLESLIPKQQEGNNQSKRHLAEDILVYQENLEETTHGIRFASESLSDLQKSFQQPVAKLADTTIPAPVTKELLERKPGLYTGEPVSKPAKTADSVFWIEVDKIDPNPFQPRREMEETALKSLAESIKSYGVLQPLLVSKMEEETPKGLSVRYQLIAGERRWRASRLAGLREVPVIIKKDRLHDRLKLELALIENVQREDLNPVERAFAFKQLIDDFRLTQKEISEKIGKSREYVTNSLRLLTLPQEMQENIKANVISEGHGRALLMLSGDTEKQRLLFNEISEGKISVREAELAARALVGHKPGGYRKGITKLDHSSRVWQKQLEDALGTRVSLVKMDGGKGRIIVEFYSDEELQNILDKMIREV